MEFNLFENHEETNKLPFEEEQKKKGKISAIYANVITETVYSSDSDCEYEIMQTVVRVNSNRQDIVHVCKFCSKRFIKVDSLLRHLENHNGMKSQAGIFEGIEPLTEDNSEQSGKKESRHACDKCSKTFSHPSNLAKHYKCHVIQSVILQKQKFKSDGNSKLKYNRYTCPFCSKAYLYKVMLKKHIALAHNDKQQTEMVLEEPQSSQCHLCGKSFSTLDALNKHLSAHHENRLFLCNICGKAYKTTKYLMIHMTTHAVVKPFNCNDCSKHFTTKASLQEHVRRHTGEKPFSCDVCSKTFAQYSGLSQHMRTHSTIKNHTCNVCGKAFRFAGGLTEHIRTHTGDKPYQCSDCKKRFLKSSALKVHERTHTGDRPFKCEVCCKYFIKSNGLKQHKKNHPACNIHEKDDT